MRWFHMPAKPSPQQQRPRKPPPLPPPPPPPSAIAAPPSSPQPAPSQQQFALAAHEATSDYVTLPVAVETDADHVLTPQDMRDIERHVLRAVPHALRQLATGQLAQPPRHLPVDMAGATYSVEVPPPLPPGGAPSGPLAAVWRLPGAFVSALSPGRGRISDLLRPLLRKVRPTASGTQQLGPPAGGQQQLPPDVPRIPPQAPYAGSHRPVSPRFYTTE